MGEGAGDWLTKALNQDSELLGWWTPWLAGQVADWVPHYFCPYVGQMLLFHLAMSEFYPLW
jgi:hypothetical protein